LAFEVAFGVASEEVEEASSKLGCYEDEESNGDSINLALDKPGTEISIDPKVTAEPGREDEKLAGEKR